MAINYSKATASNKPLGVPGLPVAFESYFYDETNFITRPYNSTDEVLSYLNTAASRRGNKSIFVKSGDETIEYWFKDGTLDSNLVLKSVNDSQIYDYVVKTTNGVVTATGINKSFPSFTGSASFVIQSAINALRLINGGSIYITSGSYNLTDQIFISGHATDQPPLDQITITGSGYSTILIQNTDNVHAIKANNRPAFTLENIRIVPGPNAGCGIILDNDGPQSEVGGWGVIFNNVIVNSNSTRYPAVHIKNTFDCYFPALFVYNVNYNALVVESVSNATIYGNSHFGFLRCYASPNHAGLILKGTNDYKPVDMLSFDNYECIQGLYGVYLDCAATCSFNFVDIEYIKYPIWFQGTAARENLNNSFLAGYLYPQGADCRAITISEFTGGTIMSLNINTDIEPKPDLLLDEKLFRAANVYNLSIGIFGDPTKYSIAERNNTMLTIRHPVQGVNTNVPTPQLGDMSNKVATTEFVKNALLPYAPIRDTILLGETNMQTAKLGGNDIVTSNNGVAFIDISGNAAYAAGADHAGSADFAEVATNAGSATYATEAGIAADWAQYDANTVMQNLAFLIGYDTVSEKLAPAPANQIKTLLGLQFYALINSPKFTGIPTVDTAPDVADSSLRLATTQFVKQVVAAGGGGSGGGGGDASQIKIDDIQVYDYVIRKNGTSYVASPRISSGLPLYSTSSAYTTIQSAINQIQTLGGGSIYLGSADYQLSDELVITGWSNNNPPDKKIIIRGNGNSTSLIQTTANKNGLVIKNKASVIIEDLYFYVGANSRSAMLLDDNGASSEMSVWGGTIDNIYIQSNSTGYPAFYAKNFFDLNVPHLVALSSDNHAIMLENTSPSIHYGNSSFGFIRATASRVSPFAALYIKSSNSNGAKFLNLMTFTNLESTIAYRGIFIEGGYLNTFLFVDLESLTQPIYFTGNASAGETRFNKILSGYILVPDNSQGITNTLLTAGNEFNLFIEGGPTITPILDQCNFRQPNSYNIQLATDNSNNISIVQAAKTSLLVKKANTDIINNLPLGTNLSNNQDSLSFASVQEILNATNIVADGDSFTEGEGGYNNTYLSQFAALSGMMPYNNGISGTTSAQILARVQAATNRLGYAHILWSGRNDIPFAPTAAQIQTNIANTIAAYGHNRFVVIGILPDSSEASNSAAYIKLKAVNTNSASLYGERYIDALAVLQAHGDGGANDNADIAAGRVPRSLVADTLHLNVNGYRWIAEAIFAKINLLTTVSNKLVSLGGSKALNPFGSDQLPLPINSKILFGGQQVLRSTGTTSNLFVGDAGARLTSGQNNFSGSINALKALTSGNQNVAVGNFSGYNISSGSENICIGFSAGGGGNMNWCTFIGNQAGINATTTYGSTAIGHNANLPKDGTSNFQLSIMEAIYGLDLDGSGGNISTGNIGLFTKAPTARFHLPAGAAGAGKAPLKLTAGVNLTTPEAGVFEFDGNNLYFTIGTTRKTVTLT